MKVVFKGVTDKGLEILIRYPQKTDLKILRDYINTLSKEKTFIRFQGEQVSLKEERQFLKSQLEVLNKLGLLL